MAGTAGWLPLEAKSIGMDIKLRLFNHPHDVNDSNIVIFQKDFAEDFDENAVAWRVVKNLGIRCHYRSPIRWSSRSVPPIRGVTLPWTSRRPSASAGRWSATTPATC